MKEGPKTFDVMPPSTEAADRGGSGFNTPFQKLRETLNGNAPAGEGRQEVEGDEVKPEHRVRINREGKTFVKEEAPMPVPIAEGRETVKKREVKETLESVVARVPDLGPTLELLRDPKLSEETFIELMAGFNVVHGKDQTRLFDRIDVESPLGKVWVKAFDNGSVTITGRYDAEQAAAARPEAPKFEPVPMPRAHQSGEVVEGEGFVMGRRQEAAADAPASTETAQGKPEAGLFSWIKNKFRGRNAEERMVGLDLNERSRAAEVPSAAKTESAPAPEKKKGAEAASERPEMEPFLKAIAEKREGFGAAYREAQKALGARKEKKYKDALDMARVWEPQAGDGALLASEDKDERRDALERKTKFLRALTEAGLSQDQSEAIYERDLREAEYKAAKNDYKNKFLGTRFEELAQDYRTRLGKLPKDLNEAEQKEFREKMGEARLELYQKLVVHEADELAIEKVKGMDRTKIQIMLKMLERGKDGFRAYGEINRTWKGRLARTAATTALVTGGALALGTVAPAGMALFAANRFRKTLMASALSGPIVQGVNSGLDKIFGDPQKSRDLKVAKMLRSVDVEGLKDLDLETAEDQHLKISKSYRRSLWARAGVKASVAVAAGMGVSAAMNFAEADMFGPSASAAEHAATEPLERGGGGQFTGDEVEHATVGGAVDEVSGNAAGGDLEDGAHASAAESYASDETGTHTAETAASGSEIDTEGLSEVRQGEGAWHAVRRQLAARQGFDAEDLAKPEVKAELDRQTMNILKDNGFIGEGKERWVMQPGAHVKLGEDARLEYDEAATAWHEAGPSETAPTPASADYDPSSEDRFASMVRDFEEHPEEYGPEYQKGVEFFKHLQEHPDEMKRLEEQFGHDHFGAFAKIMEGADHDLSHGSTEALDATTKAHVVEQLSEFARENQAIQEEYENLNFNDTEGLAALVERMKAQEVRLEELRAELGHRAVAEVGIGISPERAADHIENVKKAATLASFSEKVMDPSEFPKALNHQLTEHMTGYSNLPSGYRREISAFLIQQIEADNRAHTHKIVPWDIAGISRSNVDFAPLLNNKALMADALQFPREARLLENFGFHSGDYLSSEYLQVLRNVSVSEYLEQAKIHSRPGEIMEFLHEGKTAIVVPDDSHLRLAKAMAKFAQSEVGDMSVADFLKYYDAHK